MALNGITLMKNSTGITVSGGTATVYDTDGAKVDNGIHVVDTAETNFLIRPHVTFKNKPHALQSDGTYSKGVRTVIVTIPKVLASGKIAFTVARLSFELHPELTSAEIAEIRRMAVQAVIDSETDAFYSVGSTK